MRTRFQPEMPDPATFVRSATIVPDSNVLLGLYRLSPGARTDALAALEAVAERLWLPHQVGLEFYRNLEEVRRGLDSAYASARQAVEDLRKASAAFGDGRRHEDSREAMKAAINTAVEALLGEIDRLRHNDPAIVDPENDGVLSRIEALFDGRVGAEPPDEVIQRRVEHFIGYRVPNLIPPGYEDVKRKPQPIRAAGDYLLWCELLDRAEEDGGSVLLVSDDAKSDWYRRVDGKLLGPRQELVVEFARRSRGGYYQMTLSRFAELAKEVLGADVAEASVDEIESAGEESVRETELAEPWLKVGTASVLGHAAGLASATPTYGALAEAMRQASMPPTYGALAEAMRQASMPPTYGALAEAMRLASATPTYGALAEAMRQASSAMLVPEAPEPGHLPLGASDGADSDRGVEGESVDADTDDETGHA